MVINWNKLPANAFNDREVLKKVCGAVQNFMQAPSIPEIKRHMVQNFTTGGDFPASVAPTVAKYNLTNYFDFGYEAAFRQIDMRNSQRNSAEIQEISGAIVFEKVAEGNNAKVYSVSGDSVTVKFDMYGAGLQWSRKLLDDREYATMEDLAEQFRNAYWSSKAANHYALIEAVGATNATPWQNPEPSGLPNTDAQYTTNRDIQTLNKAAQTVFENTKNAGFGVSPMTPLILYVPLALVPRYTRALAYINQPVVGSPLNMIYNIRMIATAGLSSNSYAWLVLPGFKNMMFNRMDLTMFDKFDAAYYAEVMYGWARYGAAINPAQVSRIATSA